MFKLCSFEDIPMYSSKYSIILISISPKPNKHKHFFLEKIWIMVSFYFKSIYIRDVHLFTEKKILFESIGSTLVVTVLLLNLDLIVDNIQMD